MDLSAIAVGETRRPRLRPLPGRAVELLLGLGAPPRLVAHLRLVHDVAVQLTAWVEPHCPALVFDAEAVLFGAATHDIGKAVYTAELSRSGSLHEEAGRELLLVHGVSPGLARFAGSHASWDAPGVGVEGRLAFQGEHPV